MNELHLFAGAGGGILGGMLLGHTCVCAVEIEPYCREVLLQRQRDGILPKFPIWDDVRTFDGKPWKGIADVVCGGFPCQEISEAGSRIGIQGKRSSLWLEMARVIGEVNPRFVFIENSRRIIQSGLGRVLSDLAKMGYDARWGLVGASSAGAPQGRERFWLVAHANGFGFDSLPEVAGVAVSAPGQTALAWNGRSVGDLRGSSGRVFPASESDFLGVAERHPREMAEPFRAAGNLQVPSVVKLAWETLINQL